MEFEIKFKCSQPKFADLKICRNMSNPLLETFNTPFEVPPFSTIRTDHYLPALNRAISLAREEIDKITAEVSAPTFENTIVALENSGELLGRISSVLFNLNSAETSEALQAVARDASPLLSEFDNEVKQDTVLWNRIKEVYHANPELNTEDRMLLEKTYKSFQRSGADLQGEDKDRFKEISMVLARLTLQFGENILAETNGYFMTVENEEELSGLPEDVKLRAAETAKEKDLDGKWVFTLHAPSYVPFMEHADKRGRREQLYKAYMSKALRGDEHDNQENIRKLVTLREEKARLLGYDTYATYVLEERMAKSPQEVFNFLNELLDRALPKAKSEVEELVKFMKKIGADHDLQRWDWAYYSEKLRKEKYNLDDELTKPYFQLEKVIDGVFNTAERLYGIKFRENENIPVYHADVKAYEVIGEQEEVVAIFFADYFPRAGKRGGAWMTSFREQKLGPNGKVIPLVSIVCNFTPSTADLPSLLKFDEVKTLFHEFGHALHGMLANTRYGSLSGTSVFWDFVELPSQIFENWCFEKECLDLFATHYKTGEKIPQEYIDRIRESAVYHEAYATIRQISFGLLDMSWHHRTKEELGGVLDILEVERRAFAKTELFPAVENTNMSVQFGHIFAGGYAAGYYSYKWAEVLDADAFELFKERGIFDKETARSFKESVLSKGGTEHPMDLYIRFRGKKPSSQALLKRAGLD